MTKGFIELIPKVIFSHFCRNITPFISALFWFWDRLILKGRAKIRKLEIKAPFYKNIFERFRTKDSYEIQKFTKIIDSIMDASGFYEKAAETSPKNSQLCNACSISMSCLSEMLDYMLAVIKQEKTPNLETKLKDWNDKITIAENVHQEYK